MESEGSSIKRILGNIVTFGHSTYYEITNADGKQWILPAKNIKTAFNLYQPSGWRGKLLKRLFPLLHNIKYIRNILHVKEYRYSLNSNLQAIFTTIFKVEKVEFAIFMGTPSVHQKITIQLSKGDKILGYAKFSDNNEINVLFKQEEQILKYLHSCDIIDVPKCLYCKNIADNICMFLQSSHKTNHSKVIHTFKAFQSNFLLKLADNTQKNILFEESDFYNDIVYLQTHSFMLGAAYEKLIDSKIHDVLTYYHNREVSFSVYHGDYTPWNMFVEKNNLFVFDWEYARMTYPPYLDYFHFRLQTAIFEKRKEFSDILIKYQQEKNSLDTYFSNPNFAFICYLLAIISQYVRREKSGKFCNDVANNMHIWLNLLSQI